MESNKQTFGTKSARDKTPMTDDEVAARIAAVTDEDRDRVNQALAKFRELEWLKPAPR